MLLEMNEFYDYPPSNLENLVRGKQPIHLLSEEDHFYLKGGILRLPPSDLKQPIRESSCLSTSYPRKTPLLLEREEFYD
jgi:hypothetical protein